MAINGKMVVIKKIKDGRHTLAKVGTVLDVVKDYSRIGGVEVLRKSGGRYVCDQDSFTARTCCEPLLEN